LAWKPFGTTYHSSWFETMSSELNFYGGYEDFKEYQTPDLRKKHIAQFDREFWTISECTSDMSVLEIGCGPGSFAEDLVGRELVCLDPIPEMLRTAEERVNVARKSRGEEPAEFVKGIAENLPFEDDYFDAVCTLFSFRDWFDKRTGLTEALRVLKPGATLVIIEPAKLNSIHGFLGVIWMKYWVAAYARIVCGVKDHPWKWLTKTYSEFGTTRDYINMLKQTGFTDVSSKLIFPGMATIWHAKAP